MQNNKVNPGRWSARATLALQRLPSYFAAVAAFHGSARITLTMISTSSIPKITIDAAANGGNSAARVQALSGFPCFLERLAPAGQLWPNRDKPRSAGQ